MGVGRRRGGAGLLVTAAVVVAGCAGGGSSTAELPSTTTTSATTSTAAPPPYATPAPHASDWGAPDEPLPDAPRPYGPSPRATADPAFYDLTTLDAAAVGAARPGTLLRSEPVEATGTLAGAPAWRVLYRSTTAAGAPAVVSGFVVVPTGAAPAAGRPVALWGHGTTGIADRCAPSARGDLFYDDLYGAEGRRLLDLGFAVVATDYHGLGTPGVHDYLRTDELARAMLDALVAAHDLDAAGPLGPDFVTIGHSEGGAAVLAVDERIGEVPDGFRYRGGVAAAPATQLDRVAPATLAVPGRGYGALILEAVGVEHPDLAPDVALGPKASARRALLTHGCWEEAVPGFDDIDPFEMVADTTVGDRLGAVLTTWARLDAARAHGPLLVVQGGGDTSVPEALTSEWVGRLCAAGVDVEEHVYPGVEHDPVLDASATDVVTWLRARLAGDPPPSGCPGT